MMDLSKYFNKKAALEMPFEEWKKINQKAFINVGMMGREAEAYELITGKKVPKPENKAEQSPAKTAKKKPVDK